MTEDEAETRRIQREEPWKDYVPIKVVDVNTGQRWWRKTRWQEYRLTEAHFKDLVLVNTTLYFLRWRKTREGIELRPVASPVWAGVLRMPSEQADKIWKTINSKTGVSISLDGRADDVAFEALIDQVNTVLGSQLREPDETRMFDASLGKGALLKFVANSVVPKRKDAEFYLLIARKLLTRAPKR